VITVKITIIEPQDGEENEIIIKCNDLSPEIMHLLNKLRTQHAIIAYIDNEIHKLDPADIYYIETVNNKTFLYGEDSVYESRKKLYELEEMLKNNDFLRVGKSLIVNLNKLKSFAPALSGRLEAVLANGERITISRQYVSVLKERFGI